MIGHANGFEGPPDWQVLPVGEPRLRVLIADHDGLARRMMRTALGEADRIAMVVAAGDGREALQLARYHRPSVAIIDTALPPWGGVELIDAVLWVTPQTRVLTISVGDEPAALAGLRAGAVGHLDKDVSPDQLARLVVEVADGAAMVPQRLIMPLLELVREVPRAGWRPLHSQLTTREWEIVELLGEDAGTDRIAKQLVVSRATVYSHVKSIMRKLGVNSRRDVAAAAERLRKAEVSVKHPLVQANDRPPLATVRIGAGSQA